MNRFLTQGGRLLWTWQWQHLLILLITTYAGQLYDNSSPWHAGCPTTAVSLLQPCPCAHNSYPFHTALVYSFTQTDRQTDILPPSLCPSTAGRQRLHRGYSRHRDGTTKWLYLNFQFGLFDQLTKFSPLGNSFENSQCIWNIWEDLLISNYSLSSQNGLTSVLGRNVSHQQKELKKISAFSYIILCFKHYY